MKLKHQCVVQAELLQVNVAELFPNETALGSSASLFRSSNEERPWRHVHLSAILVGPHAAAFLHIYFRIQRMLWNIQIRILILRASALCVDR